MAYDERDDRRRRGWGRESQWRGDPSFGGGWGNQLPRAHRLGDRAFSGPGDDPDYGAERYGPGGPAGYGADLVGGGYNYGPGFDPEFHGGPRFDRADVGSVGTHGVHPVSSASSPGYGGGLFGNSARDFAITRRDPQYREWRERQIEALDRDYDEYRRENQSRFDREFGAWREKRGQQREAIGKVEAHMEVVGADGGHVGTVDCTRGDSIILTKGDDSAGGVHHSIPCSWVEKVADKVILNLDAEDAKERWRAEGRSRALFEREGSGSRGPHILNRSFSGTYSDEE